VQSILITSLETSPINAKFYDVDVIVRAAGDYAVP